VIATEWKTLVLNKDWRPISIVPALKAVTKVFNGRALFINPETHCLFEWEDWILEWEDAIRTAKIDESRVMPLASWKLLLPEIIVCTEYRGYGSRTNNGQSPKFSRRNLFLRDRNTCQFCGKKFPSDDMTMDHVIPKSKGGKTDWYNIVLACVACNRNKADKSLKDSGMKLIRKPYHPTAEELRLTPADRIRMQIISRPPKTWEQFLGKMLSEMYWRVELLP
jgi:hypothetical protein